MTTLPTDAVARGDYPMADGLLFYFPAALAEVARVSKIGNDQHNPGEPMHWARGKSMDHDNKIIRHLLDAAESDEDTDGSLHAAKLAWRALAKLQELCERRGAPLAPNARLPVAESASTVAEPTTPEFSPEQEARFEAANPPEPIDVLNVDKARSNGD